MVDIYSGFGYVDNVPEFQLILNQEPKQEWVVAHKNAQDFRYLPIDKVEFLLDRLFGEYKIEILKAEETKSASLVVVRVHYLMRPKGKTKRRQWTFHDGVGSCLITTGTNEMAAFPMAKSLAVKDACDHIGNIFGRNLNRKEPQVLIMSQDKKDKTTETRELVMKAWSQKLSKVESNAELIQLYNKKEHPDFINSLFTKRKLEINGK
jgi:hypothetical protein